MTDPVRQIADAVLYEGYLLWPYRRSATKNRRRWTFGGVYPPGHSALHPDDPSQLQAEVEVEGDPQVDVRVRFLQVVERSLRDVDGNPVDELPGWLAWDEATERELGPGTFTIAAGAQREAVDGGTIVRSWRELHGRVDVTHTGNRVRVVIANETPWAGGARDDALRQTLCSTHAVLHTRVGAFVSATESDCESVGLWPVLVGAADEKDTMLASPIILYDYPQVAPESPGDFFDGTEIDELLTLRILTLGDEEKLAACEGDPHARALVERTQASGLARLMRLHGAMRT
jgi:hydrogenase maturation protease